MKLIAIDEISHLIVGAVILFIILSSNVFSDSFIALISPKIITQLFTFRLLFSAISAFVFMLMYAEFSHKHPMLFSLIIFLLFVFSPFVSKVLSTLDINAFLSILFIFIALGLLRRHLIIPSAIASIIAVLINPLTIGAFVPIFVMYYIHNKQISLLDGFLMLVVLIGVSFGLSALAHVPMSIDVFDYPFVFAVASASVFIRNRSRVLWGFISSLPFLFSPYVIFPMLIVAIDVVSEMLKHNFINSGAISFMSFVSVFSFAVFIGIQLINAVSLGILSAFLVAFVDFIYPHPRHVLFLLLITLLLISIIYFIINVDMGGLLAEGVCGEDLIMLTSFNGYVLQTDAVLSKFLKGGGIYEKTDDYPLYIPLRTLDRLSPESIYWPWQMDVPFSYNRIQVGDVFVYMPIPFAKDNSYVVPTKCGVIVYDY